MHRRVEAHSRETLNDILHKGANLDEQDLKGQTALCFALQTDDYAKASLLLSRGANVNIDDKDGVTALHYAVTHAEPDQEPFKSVILSILDRADKLALRADAKGQTALHTCAKSCSTNAVMCARLILESTITNIDHGDSKSFKALDYVIQKPRTPNTIQMVKLLLKFGANPAILKQSTSSVQYFHYSELSVMDGRRVANGKQRVAKGEWQSGTLFI
jgi:ankyrin repeat protein